MVIELQPRRARRFGLSVLILVLTFLDGDVRVSYQSRQATSA